MGVQSGKKLNTLAHEEHDDNTNRKRVQAFIEGDTVAYEDASFVAGDSPAVCSVETDLGRLGHAGYVIIDGTGSILVEFSEDGTSYGGQHTLKGKETLEFENLNISKIRITFVANTAYRAFVV